MSPQIDELRPPTAARLLTIWRTCREMADDPLERVLLCNAHILKECCFFQGGQAFADETAVLEALTGPDGAFAASTGGGVGKDSPGSQPGVRRGTVPSAGRSVMGKWTTSVKNCFVSSPHSDC